MNVPDAWVLQQIGQLYLESKLAQEAAAAAQEKLQALEEAVQKGP